MVADTSVGRVWLRRAVIWVTLVVVALVQVPAVAQAPELESGIRAIGNEEPKGDGKQVPERLEPGRRRDARPGDAA